MIVRNELFAKLAVAGIIGLATLTAAAQTDEIAQGSVSTVATVANGEKAKVSGVVSRREGDVFYVRDSRGTEMPVRIGTATKFIEKKGNPFRGGKEYTANSIVRGLSVDVEGRGDAAGQLSATKIKFSDREYRLAQSIDTRVSPVEGRVGQVEQNAQRLSGQLDELAAVSNAARGGARAAQASADAAIGGVRATNDRISALDDYVPQQSVSVNFRVGSAVLSPQSKTQLDELAQQALNARGYVVEVNGFTDSSGNAEANRRLSENRANAVVRYLVETHNIPRRRIVTPYGYGASHAVAENSSRDGRAQNRRVEVTIMVNKGLMQAAPSMEVAPTQQP